jgi:adenine phosphoribosyltransferase
MDVRSALALIRPIPDYPKPGILFQDITPLLSHPLGFKSVITEIARLDTESEIAVGIEARGFILASAVAVERQVGFVPVRKKGKLPSQTFSRTYGLEYGTDEIEMHCDAFSPGTKVTLIDDVLATGGTLEAAMSLIADAGGIVSSVIVLLEIAALGGRHRIEEVHPGIPLHALVTL